MKFFITGKRRGLGQVLSILYDTVDTLEERIHLIACVKDEDYRT